MQLIEYMVESYQLIGFRLLDVSTTVYYFHVLWFYWFPTPLAMTQKI